MHNGILLPAQSKPADAEWSWRTRARAWIFGMGPEALLGLPVSDITDGESYAVHAIWEPGIPIPKGESDRAKRAADACAEFHMVQEMTLTDLQRAAGFRRVCPAHAFWLKPRARVKGIGKAGWDVCYVARKGTSAVDLLCLRDRLGAWARLFVAMRSFRMGVMQAQIEEGL